MNEALSVAMSREEGWTRKYSTICECRGIFSQVEELWFVPTQANTYNFNTACHHALPALKKQTNQIVAEKYPNQNNRIPSRVLEAPASRVNKHNIEVIQ